VTADDEELRRMRARIDYVRSDEFLLEKVRGWQEEPIEERIGTAWANIRAGAKMQERIAEETIALVDELRSALPADSEPVLRRLARG
jgi:hypothetical protein